MKKALVLILILSFAPLAAWAQEESSISPEAAIEATQQRDSSEDSKGTMDPAMDPNMSFDDEASLGGSLLPAESNRFFDHILQFSDRYPSANY